MRIGKADDTVKEQEKRTVEDGQDETTTVNTLDENKSIVEASNKATTDDEVEGKKDIGIADGTMEEQEKRNVEDGQDETATVNTVDENKSVVEASNKATTDDEVERKKDISLRYSCRHSPAWVLLCSCPS